MRKNAVKLVVDIFILEKDYEGLKNFLANLEEEKYTVAFLRIHEHVCSYQNELEENLSAQSTLYTLNLLMNSHIDKIVVFDDQIKKTQKLTDFMISATEDNILTEKKLLSEKEKEALTKHIMELEKILSESDIQQQKQ